MRFSFFWWRSGSGKGAKVNVKWEMRSFTTMQSKKGEGEVCSLAVKCELEAFSEEIIKQSFPS